MSGEEEEEKKRKHVVVECVCVECKNLKVLAGRGKSRKGKVQLTSK